MKSLLLLIATLSLSFSVIYAQDLEFTFQKRQSTFGLKLLPVDDHQFVAGFRGLYHNSATLMMFDSSGSVLWEQSTDFNHLKHISDISMNPDTSFLVIGWVDGDVGNSAINRIDKNGNYVAHVQNLSGSFFHGFGYHCAYWTDGMSIANDADQTYFTNGFFATPDIIFTEVINDLERVDETSTVLVAQDDGITLFDSLNNFINEPTNYTSPVHQVKYGLDSTVIVLDEICVKTLNENFITAFSFPLPDSLNNFKITVDNQQVYLIGKSENYQPYLFILNDTLGLKSFQPILSNYQIVNDIQIHNQQLLVIGDDHLNVPTFDFTPGVGNYGHRDGMNAFIKSFDNSGNTKEYIVDVGVTNVETIGEIEYSNFDSCYNSSFPNNMEPIADILFPTTFVEITNFGEETIHRVAINFRHKVCFLPYSNRSWRYFEWNFDGLNLVSGESTTLELNEFISHRYPLFQDTNLPFWTSVPNQKIDRNHLNDEYIHNFLISNLNEKGLSKNNVHVYPNPAKDKFFLNLKKPFSQDAAIVIYNNFSQKIGEFILKKGNVTTEIDIQNLHSGIYYWEVISATEKIAGRFFKL